MARPTNAYRMIRNPVLTVFECSELELAAGWDGRSVLLMMKANEPLGRAKREARLPSGNESLYGMSAAQKLKADFPEPEVPDEEEWEKERKTALAQIQNALKFCVGG